VVNSKKILHRRYFMPEKLKFAIIGCGKVAAKHIKAYMHNKDLVELVALSDISREAAEKLLKNSKLKPVDIREIKIFTDYRKMLDNISPDIAAVTTPSGTHALIGADVIKRNIHLLLEKPMTLSLKESDMLIDLASKHNVKIALGHIYRFFPIVDFLSEDISKGVFGKVLYGNVKVFWGHDQKYYDQASWRGTWNQDGGVLMNQSVHALDLMLYLMGGSIKKVSAMLGRQIHDMQAEDIAMGIMKFDNGSFCTIEGTTNTNPDVPQASFFICCTEGSILAGINKGKPFFDIRDKSNKKISFRYIRKLIQTTRKDSGLISLKKFTNPHSGILKDLVQCILNDKNPRADGLSGKKSLELVLGMYKSAKEGREISLPLENFSTDDMVNFSFD